MPNDISKQMADFLSKHHGNENAPSSDPSNATPPGAASGELRNADETANTANAANTNPAPTNRANDGAPKHNPEREHAEKKNIADKPHAAKGTNKEKTRGHKPKKGHKPLPKWAPFLIAAVIVVIAGLLTTYLMVIRPQHVGAALMAKASEQGDFNYELNLTHTVTDGELQKILTRIKAEGTYLGSTQQADSLIKVWENEDQTESCYVMLDGDDMYIDTKALMTLTGKYWLGDLNTEDELQKMYDDIFNSDVTLVNLNSYLIPHWGSEYLWSTNLNLVSSILISGGKTELEGLTSYRNTSGGAKVTLDAKDLAKIISANKAAFLDNRDAYAVADSMNTVHRAYANEISKHSSVFNSELYAWCMEQAELWETEEHIAEFEAKVAARHDSLLGEISERGGSAVYTVKEDSTSLTQTLVVTLGSESWELSFKREAAYETRIDSVPDHYETIAVQVMRLEEAYGTILSTGVFPADTIDTGNAIIDVDGLTDEGSVDGPVEGAGEGEESPPDEDIEAPVPAETPG